MNFKPAYQYSVKTFSRKVGKKKFRMFWMDRSEESNFSTERIFEPSFALRKIKHYLNDDSFELLCWAVENNLIPCYKNNAKRELYFLKLQNIRDFTNEKKVRLKPEIEKENSVLDNKNS